MTVTSMPRAGRLGTLLVVLLIAAVATGWRLNAYKIDFYHPDEQIAVAVIERVLAESTLDTNWARTEVHPDFRYNQYNFSAYYLVAAGCEALAGLLSEPTPDRLTRLRGLSAVLGGLIVLFAGLLGARLGGGLAAGATAALLSGACLTLFQDSMYARPEAFTGVLLLAILMSGTGPRALKGLGAAGLLVGLLVATKVSFVVLIPFPFLAAVFSVPRPRGYAAGAARYAAAVAAGFALGAPYAVLNPQEYLQGIDYLQAQYARGHWPHGVHDGSLLQRLQHSGAYLSFALGTAPLLLAAVGLARLLAQRRAPVLILLAGVVASVAYFLLSRTFFERNLSHALPVLFVLTAVGASEIARRIAGTRSRLGTAAALLMAVALAWPVGQVTRKLTALTPQEVRTREIRAFEKDIQQERLLVTVDYDVAYVERASEWLCGPVVFRLTDFGDRYTAARLAALLERGRIGALKRFPGPFHSAPPSTLQVYHAADLVYLEVREAARHNCQLAFERMATRSAAADAAVPVELAGAAMRGGQPGDARIDWPRSIYSTYAGSDGNVGTIMIGPFRACGAVEFPLISGPTSKGNRLEIAQLRDHRWETILSRHVPYFVNGWSIARLPAPGTECRSLRITALDPGVKWGQWVGIGEPLSAGAAR